ncbi:MAG: hypothetical protein IPL49_17715 [Saprospirales bacterium]|nr:hypothetical protein [Saprospirales bacterium]MBK8492669.1 hypothetical protein [Saprospirales bacterium]
MKILKITQTFLLFLLTAATLTIVVQNQRLLQRMNERENWQVHPTATFASDRMNEVIDVRIVDVKDEIPVNIEEINGFNIFGRELPVSGD